MPDQTEHATQEHEKIQELIQDFNLAMFITRGEDGELHSRPLSIVRDESSETLYFPTSLDSPKVEQLSADSRAYITMQEGRVFVALSGEATVSTDRSLVDRLWSEAWKVWFPDGKDDPRVCVISFVPESGEYWDNDGVQGLKYLFESAKALLKRTRPESSSDENAKVDFSSGARA